MHAPPPLLFFLNDQEKLTPYPTQKEAAGKPEVAAECVCVCGICDCVYACMHVGACAHEHARVCGCTRVCAHAGAVSYSAS